MVIYTHKEEGQDPWKCKDPKSSKSGPFPDVDLLQILIQEGRDPCFNVPYAKVSETNTKNSRSLQSCGRREIRTRLACARARGRTASVGEQGFDVWLVRSGGPSEALDLRDDREWNPGLLLPDGCNLQATSKEVRMGFWG